MANQKLQNYAHMTMERWEALLDQYSASSDITTLENVIHTAQDTLADDLAPFEIDWFLESLFVPPVCLLEAVSARRADDASTALLGKAFALLTDVVNKYDNAHVYYEDIERLCALSYPARVAAKALACLSSLARRHRPAEGTVHAQLAALSHDAAPCKAARCELLGVVCEHHPELFPDVTVLWRTFIAILDSTKSSLDLKKEVLLAVSRLFKHFGQDLVVREVCGVFYDHVKALIKTVKCHEVCCSILEQYPDLLQEKLSADAGFRAELWGSLSKASQPALLAVYRTCFRVGGHLQTIISELESKCSSDRPLTKFTALRVLCVARGGCGGGGGAGGAPDGLQHADVQFLEWQLRNRRAHQHVEAISWCISANVLYSERLLQAAILFSDGLPAAARHDIIVRNVLDAPADMRTVALAFLTSETCLARADRREPLLAVWRALAAAAAAGDVTLLDHYLRHATSLLHTLLDEQMEELPPKVSALLDLTAFVLETFSTSARTATSDSLARAAGACVRTYPCAGGVRVLRALAARGTVLREFYEIIDICSCEDEELLLQSCRALLEAPAAPSAPAATRQVLLAAKVLLSRSDTEPAVLSQAVNTLETIMLTCKEEEEENKQLLNEVIELVEGVRQLNDGSSKDHRILHRDVIMFLGKFGNNESCKEVCSYVELSTCIKELCLNLLAEGTTLKLDLRDTLQRAVSADDPSALHALLTLMCANLRGEAGPAASDALSRAIAALSRRSAHAARAAPLCGARGLHRLLAYAASETSPRGRRELLAAVGGALAGGGRGGARGVAELAGEIVAAAACQQNTSQTKLDLLATVIGAMNENNILSQEYLPRVLILILKTHLFSTHKVFDVASVLLIDKIALFQKEDLENLIYGVVETLCDDSVEIDMKSERIITKAVAFLKRLYDLKREELPSVMDLFGRIARAPRSCVLYVMSGLRSGFECDLQFCRDLVTRYSSFFEEFFDMKPDSCASVDAILHFISTFADILLEVRYEKTISKLSQVIESFTPDQIIYAHKNLSLCADAVRRCLGRVPQELHKRLGAWLRGPDVAGISRRLVDGEEEACGGVAEALTYLVNVFEVRTAAMLPAGGEWLRLVRAAGDVRDRDDKCLGDLLHVCLCVLPPGDVRAIVCGEDNEDTLTFCRTYISSFSKFFTRRPFVLLDAGWSELAGILTDVVRHAVSGRCGDLETVLDLVEELWPSYESRSDFNEKCLLLSALAGHAGWGARGVRTARAVRWALGVLADPATPAADCARLAALLPAGGGDEDGYRSSYVRVASALPARLGELGARGAAGGTALRALLDAAARTAHRALLEILARLAAGDSTKGWWDEAFDECMREMAGCVQLELLEHVYRCCGRAAGACDRLLVPLLRYVSPSLCEEFFSMHLEELVSVLKKQPREGAPAAVRSACAVEQTCAFNVLRIAFEKIPKQHIESPTSVLYSRMQPACERPYYLVHVVCVWGATLRARALPDDDTVRVFLCAVYNCMTAALCCRGPKPETFAAVFDAAVWRALVDPRRHYSLPIVDTWFQHTTRHAVSIDVGAGAGAASTAGTGATSRTVHFLRTLSENPFLYDLPEEEDSGAHGELELEDNPLNAHECAGTLTALVRRAACPAPPGVTGWLGWRDALCAALRSDGNTAWLLAQVVCNCKEELRAHAAALRPALLALLAAADTLNGLHLDIINTLTHWREEEITDVVAEHVDSVVRALVGRAGGEAGRRGALAALLARLDAFTAAYGARATAAAAGGCWDIVAGLFDNNNKVGLKILRILAKNKVDLHGVVEGVFEVAQRAVAAAAAGGGAGAAAGAAGAAVGLVAGALGACDTALAARLLQLGGALRDQRRWDHYVSFLYHAQREWPACCDIKIAREMADLANKIPGAVKQKCLSIVAACLAHASPGEHLDELFDTLDMSVLVGAGGAGGAGLAVVERALPLAPEPLRRRLTAQLADTGRPQLLTALEVAVSAGTPDEPPSKRPRVESPLLSQEPRVLAAAARVVTHDTLPRLAALLASDHAVRFCEAFALSVYYPLTSQGGAGPCAHRTLELFLQRVRAQDRFRSVRLREEPLDLGSPPQPTAIPSPAGSTPPGPLAADASWDAPIDVQVPLDDVLGSILRFAKLHPTVACELCVQLCRATRAAAADSRMCAMLAELLRRALHSPLVLQLARVYVDGCCELPGFAEAVEGVARAAGAGEHYGLAVTLLQEVRLRQGPPQLFDLRSPAGTPPATDVSSLSFSIEGLVSAFGSLAHWGELSARARASVAGALPALWTDAHTFHAALEHYHGAGEDWFSVMVRACRVEGGSPSPSPAPPPGRLMARADRWPRDHFHVSAVSEALEWRRMSEGSREPDPRRLAARVAPGDCLARWAARLMLRRQFLKNVEVQSDSESPDGDRSLERALSHSHQLQWCARANEMELPALALQCLEDVPSLFESEMLPWMVQKMLALRALGRQRADRGKLQEALALYEQTKQFRGAAAAAEHALAADRCRLLLLRDMDRLTPDRISSVVESLQSRATFAGLVLTDELRATLDSMFEIAMGCLYENFEGDTLLVTAMCGLLEVYVGLRGAGSGARAAGLADMVLQCVARGGPLPPAAARSLLDALDGMQEHLDEFALELVRENRSKFPAAERGHRLFAVDGSLVEARAMLALVADPGHCFLQYCERLLRAAIDNDACVWTRTFANMRAKMFENAFAGPAYLVLAKYKQQLYDLQPSGVEWSARQQALGRLVQELRGGGGGAERGELSLPQLCPALCQPPAHTAPALLKLLRLPAGASVHFEETVHVYTKSIRRAARLTVRAGGAGGAGGGVRRYIVKSGESLRADAAALRVRAALPRALRHGGYWVTPLSDDCGLIQFLEGRDPVRALLLQELPELPAPAAGSVQYRDAAEGLFREACSRVPPTLLRRAMERHCVSTEDYIRKKAAFTRSLAAAAATTWLLGVGDRHLENVLYDYSRGALSLVDWGAVGQYGRGELPCARLTRNLLAAADTHVLERELQSAVRAVRDSWPLLDAVAEVSFRRAEDCPDQVGVAQAARALGRGTALAHHVTADALRAGGGRLCDQYLQLLDEVFQDFPKKPLYTAEEQTAALLRQSTDPRVLCVTRAGWEPWL